MSTTMGFNQTTKRITNREKKGSNGGISLLYIFNFYFLSSFIILIWRFFGILVSLFLRFIYSALMLFISSIKRKRHNNYIILGNPLKLRQHYIMTSFQLTFFFFAFCLLASMVKNSVVSPQLEIKHPFYWTFSLFSFFFFN